MDTLCDLFCLCCGRRPFENDCKFVSADAGYGVRRCYKAKESTCSNAQYLVADRVAEAVVDILESRKVEEEHVKYRGIVSAIFGDPRHQFFAKEFAVGEPGQGV